MARTVGRAVTRSHRRSHIAIFSLTTLSTTESGRSSAPQIEAEQLAGRLLLTPLHLGQIAETHPRALGHLTKRLALGDPLLPQRLTDQLTQQHRLHREFGSAYANCTQPDRQHQRPRANQDPAEVPPSAQPARARDSNRRAALAPLPPDACPVAGQIAGARSPCGPSSGWATAMYTSPTGWPSCGSGPATPVVARPQSAWQMRRHPPPSPRPYLGDRSSLGQRGLVDAGQGRLEPGRIADHAADIAGRATRAPRSTARRPDPPVNDSAVARVSPRRRSAPSTSAAPGVMTG